MQLTDLQLNRNLYKTQPQTLETLPADDVAANVAPPPSSAIASGNSVTDINTNAEQLNGDTIAPGTIPPSTLDIANFGWTQTCAFTVTDSDTIAWGSGTFTSADGVNIFSIAGGNTGNMGASPARTYVYLDINVSTSAYQTSTSITAPIGIGKVLIAVCQAAIAPSTTATYALVQATQIVGDNVIANTITAEKMSVAILSAITANLGTVTAGSISLGSTAWHVDTSGNMWWGNYATYADAVTGTAPTISGAGVMQFLNIANAANISSYGLNIQLTNGSNTAAGVAITQQGAGQGILETISGSSKGIFITNTGTGRSIEISDTGNKPSIDITAASTSEAMSIVNNAASGNPTGLKVNVSNAGGNGYAFEFAGDIVESSGFAGSIARKIRLLIGGSVFYMYLYDA